MINLKNKIKYTFTQSLSLKKKKNNNNTIFHRSKTQYIIKLTKQL